MTLSLVTGGSGYFGSLLVAELRRRGDAVRVLDLIDADDRPSGVEFIAGDIRNREVVAEAVAGCGRVFHNVAQVPLAKDPALLRSVNVDGTKVLLEEAATAGVAKVVHTSSSAVFGIPDHNPVTVDTIPKPQEAYGAAKLAAEWACLRAASLGLDVTIVRPRTIVGHGRLGIFAILFDWIADGRDPVVIGDGTNRYQFVHANDLARACLAAADRVGPGVFNIGSADVQSMATTVAHLCDYAGTGATVKSVPSGIAEVAMRTTAAVGLSPFAPYHWLMYARSMWFDIEPAVAALDWSPRFSTDQMFADSYDWYLANEHHSASDSTHSHHRTSARQGVLSVAKRLTRFLPTVDAVPPPTDV